MPDAIMLSSRLPRVERKAYRSCAGNSLEQLRRESFDSLDSYDGRISVEFERSGWRRKVKAAEAIRIHRIDGIIIGLNDPDEGRFGNARRHIATSIYAERELDCNLQSISASIEGSLPKNTAS